MSEGPGEERGMCSACGPDESEGDREINCQKEPGNPVRQRASMDAFRCSPACAEGGEEVLGGETERGRNIWVRAWERERGMVAGDSSMLSAHGWMCVTQSQIGNRCFNLASLRGCPLRR